MDDWREDITYPYNSARNVPYRGTFETLATRKRQHPPVSKAPIDALRALLLGTTKLTLPGRFRQDLRVSLKFSNFVK